MMIRYGLNLFLAAWIATQSFANEPLLKPGDTLALVGGTFVERMQETAAFENELYVRRPDWKLRVRNLGWSGDDVHGFARKVFETDPNRGFERLLNDLRIAKPTVVLVAYGFTEASGGATPTSSFEPGLRKLVAALAEMKCRVLLLRPFVVPGVRISGYAGQVAECVRVVDQVGKDTGASIVEVRCDDWTEDKLSPSAAGYEAIGNQLATAMVGGQSQASANADLERLIVEKNQLFFHRHRPQNETYLTLFRKHEQGNNAVELPQFDPLIDALDQQIWERSANQK